MVVLGDFNLHDITWNLDDIDTYYLPQNIASHTVSVYIPLFQLSNAKNIASNVLDLCFVNGTDDIQSCNAPVAITKVTEIDRFHPSLEVTFEYYVGETLSPESETIEVFSYKYGNYEQMSQQTLLKCSIRWTSAFDYF